MNKITIAAIVMSGDHQVIERDDNISLLTIDEEMKVVISKDQYNSLTELFNSNGTPTRPDLYTFEYEGQLADAQDYTP